MAASRRACSTVSPLGDDGFAELPRQSEDRFDDRLPLAAFAHFAHEAVIDLDLIDRHARKIAQRGIAGAEIVERNGDAMSSDAAERLGVSASPVTKTPSVISSSSLPGGSPGRRRALTTSASMSPS